MDAYLLSNVNNIMKEKGIDVENLLDALDLVEDILLCYARDISENEPYATTTIENLKASSSVVSDVYRAIEQGVES